MIKLPITPLELIKILNGYTFTTNVLMTIYNSYNRGADVTSVLSVAELNKLFEAVNNGYEVKAVGSNKYIKILYADTEEITSDDYRAVKIVFVKSNELVTFVFTKFGTNVYLDTKTITAI